MPNRSGHSLVEVLVAGMVLLTGVVPAAAALGHSLRWGIVGRARAAAAMAAAERVELLRASARRTTPACSALSGGSVWSSGRIESWTVETAGSDRLLTVVVQVPLPHAPVGDTLRTRITCV